jgi:hypothetical protein
VVEKRHELDAGESAEQMERCATSLEIRIGFVFNKANNAQRRADGKNFKDQLIARGFLSA